MFTCPCDYTPLPRDNTTNRLLRTVFAGDKDSWPRMQESLGSTMGAEPPFMGFLRCYFEVAQRKNQPFLEDIPENIYLSDRVELLKSKIAQPLIGYEPLCTMSGPLIDQGTDTDPPQHYHDRVSTQTISTYPRRSSQGRHGDPVCDHYGFQAYSNRCISVVSDGCNWGTRPKKAAERARDTVMEYLCSEIPKIHTVRDAQAHLLRSFAEAQQSICQVYPDEPDPGSTTLVAGMTLQFQGDSGYDDWAYVCASVGDCKVFAIEHDTFKIRDVTSGNRDMTESDTDPGGRLGPAIWEETRCSPDLRNLRTCVINCQSDDLIMVMSDGVHDNFHPKTLAVPPRDLKLDFDDWKEAASVINIEEVASRYRLTFMQNLLAEVERSPSAILKRVMEHCERVTRAGREWMENNPGQPLPDDYEKYPGKMDHVTCMVFRVGSFAQPKSASLRTDNGFHFVPLSVSLYVSDYQVRLICRPMAKGRFECLAKKNGCVLTVLPAKQFSIPDSEELIGCDEVSGTITRMVHLPAYVEIDTRTKKVNYDVSSGLVTIQFQRL